MIIFKLITVFLLSIFFINQIIKKASELGLIDIPNERSSHSKEIPRGAGIGFGSAFFLSLFIWDFELFVENGILFLSIFLVFLVGILDDHKDVSPKTKFYVIFISTILLHIDNITISSLGTFFGHNISLWYFSVPFSMFALAGFTNALNLIDGLDGLAASISSIILITFFYIGYVNGDALITTITSLVIVSLISFLFFNWNPAVVFMGDSGSLYLGFIISIVAILSTKYIHPISVLFIAAIPILDTIIVMTRRIKKGLSPFSPDKTHLHHILLHFFRKKVKRTVFFISLMQVLFSLTGLMLALNTESLNNNISSVASFIGFIGVTLLFYMIFSGMHKKQTMLNKLNLKKEKKKKRIKSTK